MADQFDMNVILSDRMESFFFLSGISLSLFSIRKDVSSPKILCGEIKFKMLFP
jgi:hypothetical protein